MKNISQKKFMKLERSKHSTLIQRWYMWKKRRDVGQRYIHIDWMSICQRWVIDEIQRWNNVNFGLALANDFLLYHDAWKILVFILTLKI